MESGTQPPSSPGSSGRSGPSGSGLPPTYWRKCTTCKKLIGFGKRYWICSVSTCNRQRTGLVFCDIRCFDAHVPVLNHRDAGAFERVAPTQADALAALASASLGVASVMPQSAQLSPGAGTLAPSSGASLVTRKSVAAQASDEDEILVVVSKVKGYIRVRSGMNTSDSVMDVLSQFVRKYSDRAIENAKKRGRQTVFDQDF